MPASADPADYLSTVEAAEALGVSVSSVKRWVDAGVLPAHKTAGGHRKLLRSEVLALLRQGDLPRGDPAAPGRVAGLRAAGDLDTVARTLADALLAGRRADAGAVLRGAYRAGVPVESLADRVVAPAMATVGHDWESSRIDVWQEHRGTQICAAALYDLQGELSRRAARDRPAAVGGAPGGDPYLLTTLLAQMVLQDAGWDAVNLGPNTPLPDLLKAVRELRPRLLWLSISHLDDVPAFVEAYHRLYRACESQGVAVAVGGRALAGTVRASIPYTTYGDGLTHLAAFAGTLHPLPKRPRRGRRPAGERR